MVTHVMCIFRELGFNLNPGARFWSDHRGTSACSALLLPFYSRGWATKVGAGVRQIAQVVSGLDPVFRFGFRGRTWLRRLVIISSVCVNPVLLRIHYGTSRYEYEYHSQGWIVGRLEWLVVKVWRLETMTLYSLTGENHSARRVDCKDTFRAGWDWSQDSWRRGTRLQETKVNASHRGEQTSRGGQRGPEGARGDAKAEPLRLPNHNASHSGKVRRLWKFWRMKAPCRPFHATKSVLVGTGALVAQVAQWPPISLRLAVIYLAATICHYLSLPATATLPVPLCSLPLPLLVIDNDGFLYPLLFLFPACL